MKKQFKGEVSLLDTLTEQSTSISSIMARDNETGKIVSVPSSEISMSVENLPEDIFLSGIVKDAGGFYGRYLMYTLPNETESKFLDLYSIFPAAISDNLYSINNINRNGNYIYLEGVLGTDSTPNLDRYTIRIETLVVDSIIVPQSDNEYKKYTGLLPDFNGGATVVHKGEYQDGYLYYMTRPNSTTSTIATQIIKFNARDLNDYQIYNLPTTTGYYSLTNAFQIYKDWIYILFTERSQTAIPAAGGINATNAGNLGIGYIVRVSTDLKYSEVVFQIEAAGVGTPKAELGNYFIIHEDEIFVPLSSTTDAFKYRNTIGIGVYTMTGQLKRKKMEMQYRNVISEVNRPAIHWMTILNNKLILASSANTSVSNGLIRIDAGFGTDNNSIVYEDFFPIQGGSHWTNDNSVTPQGDVLMNPEGAYGKLLKIKYNNFPDFELIDPSVSFLGVNGYWSVSSLNPKLTKDSLRTKLSDFKNDLPSPSHSTGLISGGAVTGTGTATANVSAGIGKIVDNTVPTSEVTYSPSWSAGSFSVAALADGRYWIYSDNTGALQITATEPTTDQYRTRVQLGRVVVRTGLISGISVTANPIQNIAVSAFEISKEVGIIKNGLTLTTGSTNANFSLSSGYFFFLGIGIQTSVLSPNYISFSNNSNATFRHVTQLNVQSADTTTLDFANYDVSGTLTAIPGANSRAQIFIIFKFPNGNIRVLRGQSYYDNVTSAFNGLATYSPVIPSTFDDAIKVGYYIISKDGTTVFAPITTNKFGEIGGSTAIQNPTYDATIIDGSTNAVQGNAVFDELALKAPLASPALTGTPTAPTASANTNTTQIATTAYADAKVADNLTASTTVAPSKTAVNTALAGKEPTIATANTSRVFRGDKTFVSLIDGFPLSGFTVAAPAPVLDTDTIRGAFQKVQGSFNSMTAYVAKTAAYTITTSDMVVDLTANTATFTLPTAVGNTGKKFTVKNSGAGVLTLATTSSQTIDGAATMVFNTQYGGASVVSDGANWKVVGSF